MLYDVPSQKYSPMSILQMKEYEYYSAQANKLRKQDRKTEPSTARLISWVVPSADGEKKTS